MKSSPSKAAPSAFCKFSPLLFGFLPVLAPAAASFTPTPAHAVSAPVAVSFSIISTKGPTALVAATDMVLKEDEMKADGEEVQRLMGRVEPIDRLGQEAEGIFKVSVSLVFVECGSCKGALCVVQERALWMLPLIREGGVRSVLP